MLDQRNLKIQVTKALENHDWPKLCNVLEDSFKLKPNNPELLDIVLDVINFLGDLMRIIRNLSLTQNDNAINVLKHIYKALRNLVTYNGKIQVLVYENGFILNETIYWIQILKAIKEENGINCLKMLLQFLINLNVNNVLLSTKIWNMFKIDIKELIRNDICLYYASALAYNIFHNDICLLEENSEVIQYILDFYKENDTNEYLLFLLELFLKNTHLNKTYVVYSPEHRILCLETMKQLFDIDKSLITEELITVLTKEFKQKSDCILKTVTTYLKEIEPLEVMLLLELLAVISSNENFVKYMQKDKSLLINCAFLLKSIHSVGKQSGNNFSVISKLSQLEDISTEVLEHPSYGFKALLIRLLANMCWKNKENQDEIRELDCIPLLLDCCNIDARNPFIIQWVVFAIRNLCENNIENQRLIAAMNKQGVINSGSLSEMGITLHNDEEHVIKIVPLDLNK